MSQLNKRGNCVDEGRRQFLKLTAAGCIACSAALVLQACGTEEEGEDDDTGSGSSTTGTATTDASGNVVLTLADETALGTVGGYVRKSATGFNGGKAFLVVRTATSEFKAMTTVCTHAGGSVQNPSSNVATCSSHGAQFSVASATFGHNVGGLSTSNITPLTVTYDESAGTVTISD